MENRENKKRSESMPIVGGSSLLVVFTVLCLTVFALLSLSTAQADAGISDASARAVQNYYAADTDAEVILARLRDGEVPDGVTLSGDDTYSYTCPIDDGQLLSVVVRVKGTDYKVLKWQAETFGDWTPNDGMPVWDGEEED